MQAASRRRSKVPFLIALLGTCWGITGPAGAQSSAAFPSGGEPPGTAASSDVQSGRSEPVAGERPPSLLTPPPGQGQAPGTSTLADPTVSARDGGLVLPHRLPYQEGDPVPAGYRVDERSNDGLAIGGGVLLGVAYLASLAGAVSSDQPGQGWLAVPVVGPFGALLTQEVSCDDEQLLASGSYESCSSAVIDAAQRSLLLLVDGLFQVTGATLLLVGLSTGETSLVRDAGGSAASTAGGSDRGVRLNVSTRLSPDLYGLSVSGSF